MAINGKSHEISEILRAEIARGAFDATQKMPSDRMLMRRFAVARATIQAAMKELNDSRLVERKPGYGTFLVNRAACRAARKLAVIVPDAYYPFYNRICRGLAAGARTHGWSLFTASPSAEDLRTRALQTVELAELCTRESVSGAFFQPLQFLKNGERYNRMVLSIFRKANIPVVLLDSDFVAAPLRSEYDLVGVDSVQVGYVMARHVIACGARRICYFSNPMAAQTSWQRGDGVGLAVAEAGLPWSRRNIFFEDPQDISVLRRLFAGKLRPDAIVAANDHVALMLGRSLAKLGGGCAA